MDAATRSEKMRRLRAVREQIGEVTRRRTVLWHQRSETPEGALAPEVDRLSARIDELWSEARTLNAEIRHGDRSDIIARARQTERIERDLRRKRRPEHAAEARAR